MSGFVVSARKYRPSSFDAMLGQEHITRTLRHALKTEQLAHAFLFCGPRGVGKTTAARVLAKTINCQNPQDGEACNQCASCVSFNENTSFNVYELDAASNNSVDDIRSLVDHVRFPPQNGKFKVYIIDEVHMLSPGAFNAFLKTLEEPPPYAKFILATTEKNKILPTILSRCQIFDFRRISLEKIIGQLKSICAAENISADEDSLLLIAQKADGGMRDALSLFDRLVNYGQGKLVYSEVLENLSELGYQYYFEATEQLLAEDFAGLMNLFSGILSRGFEGEDFLNGLASHLRNLLFCKDPATLGLLECGPELRERYRNQSEILSADYALTCLHLINQAEIQLKGSKNKRLTTELALARMCFANRLLPAAENDLKKKGHELKETPAHQPKSTPQPAFPENNLAAAAATDTGNLISPQTTPPGPSSPTPSKEQTQADPASSGDTTHSPQPPSSPASPVAKPASAINRSARFVKADEITHQEEKKEADTGRISSERAFDRDLSALQRDMFYTFWTDFGKSKLQSNPGISRLCRQYSPLPEQDHISLNVHSDIQKDLFLEILPELKTAVHNKFGLWAEWKINVNTPEAGELQPFTSKEKAEFLKQQLPAIAYLFQELNLTIIGTEQT